MPFYDYKCQTCENVFEKRVKMDNRYEPTFEECPNCGQMTVKLQVTCHFERMSPMDLGRIKPNEDWRHFLNRLKKANPNSTFKTY